MVNKLKVLNKKDVAISEGMIGLFYEDINYSSDGGLYAELIENRSFESLDARGTNDNYSQVYDGGYGWSPYPSDGDGARMEYLSDDPVFNENPHYLEFTASQNQKGFTNQAYEGIPLEKGKKYKISFYARADVYDGNVEVTVRKNGKILTTSFIVEKISEEWTQYEGIIEALETQRHSDFVVELSKTGTVNFDLISLFPEDAVLGIFRKDLVELLKEMKPGFMRFPGGCIVEGNDLDNRYQWKLSIGEIGRRKANWSRWGVHGNCSANHFHGPYSHYNQTLGIGYYEYFLLCEYLNAKPIPVVNVGLACQYQSTEQVPMESEAFQEYLQDALDLIEFANGAPTTKWGKVRAEMGHPEPFNLEMLGIGNEQWQTEQVDFFGRYRQFEQVINAKYPDIKLIGSAGPDVTSKTYHDAWAFYREEAKGQPDFVYAVDEHYYQSVDWFLNNTDFYDDYPRDVKVFAGEYATHVSSGMNNPSANNWLAGLSEAAYLTGIERNADVVVLASYAPLLARLNYAQWSPNLIWFDDVGSYGTPSYYVQKLYATHMGNHTLSSEWKQEEQGCFQVTSYDEQNREIIIKLVNTTDQAQKVAVDLTDWTIAEEGKLIQIQSDKTEAVNDINAPENVAPQESKLEIGQNFNFELPVYSFSVLRIPVL